MDLIHRNEIVSSQGEQPRTRQGIAKGWPGGGGSIDMTVQAQMNGKGFGREPDLAEYVMGGEFTLD